MSFSVSDVSRLSQNAQRQVLAQMQAAQAAKAGAEAAKKYHNQPTTIAGISFDSRKEADRYVTLMSLLQAGAIRNLKLQPQFTLQESYVTPEGDRLRAIRYVADFSYERKTAPDCNGAVHWLPVVEDVKSKATKTQKYEIKKKLFREKIGMSITEV